MQYGPYFITGTDTGVGKTRVSLAMMAALKSRGLRVVGMKPVATGCEVTAEGLHNDDACLLMRDSDGSMVYKDINPYALRRPTAPVFAAQEDGIDIELSKIEHSFSQLAAQADAIVVEGVGGWRMWLGEEKQMADLVKSLRLSVILVVGFRLGCINHAMLSVDAILRDGAKFVGWVGNCLDPDYVDVEKTRDFLKRQISVVPLLGVIPYETEYNYYEEAPQLDLEAVSI